MPLKGRLGPIVKKTLSKPINQAPHLHAYGGGIWDKLVLYQQHIGKTPTREQLERFVKRCAIQELREQIKTREPTTEEKIMFLKVVKQFVWNENKEKFLKSLDKAYDERYPF
jgi:hypothetical protein